MAYSYFKYTGDGSTTTYAIPFALGFLKPEDITVRVGDEKDSAGNPVYRTWNFLPGNQGMIKIDGPVPVAGEPVVIERTVSKTKLVHDFQKGEPLDEKSLDESHEQLMMAIHELLDGRDITFLDSLDVYGDINMHGNTIRNVKPDPSDASSVATLEFVKNYGNGGAVVQEITPFTTLPGVKKYYVGDDVLLDPNANNLLLILGGVTQEPNVSYNIVDQKYVEFTAMPPEGIRCWGVASMLFSSPYIRDAITQYIESAAITVQGTPTPRPIADRFGDWTNVKDYGAVGDGITDDTSAFNTVPDNMPVYVPAGRYRLSNPYDLGTRKRFFGPGILVFDMAEHRRRGGSSGSTGNPERYTLFFDYANRDDVSVTIDGVPQVITWIDDYTIEVPGSAPGADVRVVVKNGRYALGSAPEAVRAFSCYVTGGKDSALSDLPAEITSGGNNTSLGSRALTHITSGGNNTAVGAKALQNVTTGENNTAAGFQTLYRSNGSNNTAFGSIAGEWITSGSGNTAVGANAGKKLTVGENNSALGYEALGENQAGNLNTAVGHRALGNTGDAVVSENTAVGAFAGDLAQGSRNTWVGYRSGASESGSDGEDNVAIGMFAMRKQKGADRNTAVGTGAATNIANYTDNVVVGFDAGTDLTGNGSVIIGSGAGKSASSGSVIVGKGSAPKAVGTNNVVVGATSGANLTSGINNTIVGCNAGNLGASSQAFDEFNGCSIIGYNSRATGDNQVQLGASGTTVYAYGAVQDRSDARDKADIRDSQLGLDFILALRPVDFRWDMREDYVRYSDGRLVEILPKDGSKKRRRFHHGFIAQEVKSVLDQRGLDFGGYQDHKVNGGCDILSLGYTEFIAPLVRAVQELSAHNSALEQRVVELEALKRNKYSPD